MFTPPRRDQLPAYLQSSFSFPEFYPIDLSNSGTLPLKDPVELLLAQLEQYVSPIPLQGKRIGIALGSRGINQLSSLAKALINWLKNKGATPVIIPAMGSHGGGLAEGQARLLEVLNLGEQALGASIDSRMDTTELTTPHGLALPFSQAALEVDYLILLNRIKAHTKFQGVLASGLAKMLVVGLGKDLGAKALHQTVLQRPFVSILQEAAGYLAKVTPFLGGVGLVENAKGQLCELRWIQGESWLAQEAELLQRAESELPRLPFKELDFLVLAEIGKEISGSGMDPNVTGRAGDLGEGDFSSYLKTKRIGLWNLSPKSEGNGLGLGWADFITADLFTKLDYSVLAFNALTGLSISKAKIPLVLPSDEVVLQACFLTLGLADPTNARGVIAKNTKELNRIWITASLARELGLCNTPRSTIFNAAGQQTIW